MDDYKNIIDNNNDEGYISCLYNRAVKQFPSAEITAADLLTAYALLKMRPMDAGGMERYVAYAEKARGASFAKDIIGRNYSAEQIRLQC